MFGAQNNRLIGTVPMSTPKICYGWIISTFIFNYARYMTYELNYLQIHNINNHYGGWWNYVALPISVYPSTYSMKLYYFKPLRGSYPRRGTSITFCSQASHRQGNDTWEVVKVKINSYGRSTTSHFLFKHLPRRGNDTCEEYKVRLNIYVSVISSLLLGFSACSVCPRPFSLSLLFSCWCGYLYHSTTVRGYGRIWVWFPLFL